MRVDAGRDDRLVSGEPLCQANIKCTAVQGRARGVSQRVEAKAPLESSAFLPHMECVSHLALRQSPFAPTHEEWRVGGDALASALLLAVELVELGAQRVGQDALLGVRVVVAALEHK